MSEKEPTDYDVTSQREARAADPTTSAGEAPMYVPPNSAPVLQSLIAEAAALGHWALHEQLCGVLESVDAERRRHAEEVARLEERCQSREEQLGKLSELYDVTQERLEDFEAREPDARLCAEWAATVALKATDVYSAARRYLCGESRGIVAQVQQENDSLRDQLREVTAERENRVAEMRAWGEAKLAGAQHEITHLRDRLREVEGERDRVQRANETLAVRMDLPASQLLMVGSELCGDGKIDPNDHRDPRWTPTLQRAAEVMRELTARRALDADVMACAERCRDTLIGPPGMPVEDYPLAPEALAARRILAADFLREGGE